MQADPIGSIVLTVILFCAAIWLVATMPRVIPRNEEYREDRRS